MPYKSPTDQPDRIDPFGSLLAVLDDHVACSHTMVLLSQESHLASANPRFPTANIDRRQDRPPPYHHIVRRKSGEAVPSVLRPPARPYPFSAPPTPTAKAVRFDDSQLEKVRHFFKLDQPVSISSLPERQIPTLASAPEWRKRSSPSRPQNRDLDIALSNFPRDDDARRAKPVRLERLALSADRLMLVGSAAVANLAYSKTVACRFTFDDWQTVSEVLASHSPAARTRHTPVGYDCFVFTIDLTARSGLVSETLRCCIRYSVGGYEYWDNNNNANFEVQFKRDPEHRRNSGTAVAPEAPQKAQSGEGAAPSPEGIAQPSQPASQLPDGGGSSAIEQRLPPLAPKIPLDKMVSMPRVPDRYFEAPAAPFSEKGPAWMSRIYSHHGLNRPTELRV